MRIRMNPNTTAAGPGGSLDAGKTYTVSDEQGASLVGGGYAVDVTPTPEPVAEPEAAQTVETAATSAPEKAVGRGARRK